MTKIPSIAVAIPTYNREQVLINTIYQILNQNPPANEILVIDQTDQHEPSTTAVLQSLHENRQIRWIRHSPPNLNGARNRALRETVCDVLLYIDDDVEPAPGFIASHRRNYHDPAVVAVAGRTLQSHDSPDYEKATPWLRPVGAPRFSLDATTRIEGVASFIGANHSVRVDALRRLGGYDENYVGPLFDESDMALTLYKHGGKIIFDPEAQLFHLQAPSGGTRLRNPQKQTLPEFQMSFTRVYFHWKHFFPTWYFWKHIMFVQFRRSVLRRDNVFHPWRLPWAFCSYLYSLYRAGRLLAK